MSISQSTRNILIHPIVSISSKDQELLKYNNYTKSVSYTDLKSSKYTKYYSQSNSVPNRKRPDQKWLNYMYDPNSKILSIRKWAIEELKFLSEDPTDTMWNQYYNSWSKQVGSYEKLKVYKPSYKSSIVLSPLNKKRLKLNEFSSEKDVNHKMVKDKNKKDSLINEDIITSCERLTDPNYYIRNRLINKEVDLAINDKEYMNNLKNLISNENPHNKLDETNSINSSMDLKINYDKVINKLEETGDSFKVKVEYSSNKNYTRNELAEHKDNHTFGYDEYFGSFEQMMFKDMKIKNEDVKDVYNTSIDIKKEWPKLCSFISPFASVNKPEKDVTKEVKVYSRKFRLQKFNDKIKYENGKLKIIDLNKKEF